MIEAVRRSDVIFIRNGGEHDAAAAADHLQTKYERAGDATMTAEDFIAKLGSVSSTSGRPYRVRIGGTERDAGPWLHEVLAANDKR